MINLFTLGKKSPGTVLILTLWALGLLAIFAINIGIGIRQKIVILSRLEQRSQLKLIADAGIKKAITILNADSKSNQGHNSTLVKMWKYNNPAHFHNIKVGNGQFDVSYTFVGQNVSQLMKRYGIVDEESKVNINTADADTLKRLIVYATGLDPIEADKLAKAIIDWREYGESEIVGFFSDEYYENLVYPYPPKKSKYEVMEELLLVKGMDPKLFELLRHYLTVYGDGKVNINTASGYVLLSLGLNEELVNKILVTRRGRDGIEATEDDYIFQDPYNIAGELAAFDEVQPNETSMLDELSINEKLNTNSYYYRIESKGQSLNKEISQYIRCVYNLRNNKIVYWQEK